MASLAQQWDDLVALEPADWENLFVELKLDEDGQMEGANRVDLDPGPNRQETC